VAVKMMDLEEELRRAEVVCNHGRQLLDARGRLPPEDVDGWLSELISSLEVLEGEVNNPNCRNIMRQRLLARISVMVTLSSVEDATRSCVIVGAVLNKNRSEYDTKKLRRRSNVVFAQASSPTYAIWI